VALSQHSPLKQSAPPPGVWAPIHRRVKRILAPVERFLAIQASSGILLMIVAGLALAWANSPWRGGYEALWHIPFGIRVGAYSFVRDLHFWINDGLMTIFFFVVGLEIRREIHAGELSELRRAALPVAAAVGGMIAPAIIYLSLNIGRPSVVGWAVPVATDIAFAVGVLALLGRRVRPALRILLLALAIIDDVGAIAVIALFYPSELSTMGFAILGVGILMIFAFRLLGIRIAWAYVVPGVTVWAGAYIGGIHPTLAGVLVGLMTPVRAWYGTEGFLDETEAEVRHLRSGEVPEREILSHIDGLRVANREAVSPVERLQHVLHGWVAFGIMPLFAFANAGVTLGSVSFDGDALWVFLGITIGLAAGKPIGILALSWLAVRCRVAALPNGIHWADVGVVGIVGGIGFTMGLFIAQLAFPPGVLLETAKLAILCGSGLAAILSLLAGYRFLKRHPHPGAALTEAEAETSTLR